LFCSAPLHIAAKAVAKRGVGLVANCIEGSIDDDLPQKTSPGKMLDFGLRERGDTAASITKTVPVAPSAIYLPLQRLSSQP